MLPPQVTPFLLTLAISALIGIGLRDYYESEQKYETFGTVRTFVFIGMLGFMLCQIPGAGTTAFLVGLAALVPFLVVYYSNKVHQQKSPGMIGVLIALLTYATGPVALYQPHWFLVLYGVSILFVLHSKGRVRQFTDRLETGEVVTACKFLAIAAVVLPLIPELNTATGLLGTLLRNLPVSPRQIWMAVVITTSISYLGYVFQTYLFPKKGVLLTGLIGGVYSSTLAVLVLAKKSKTDPGHEVESAAAILMAVSMMYLRVLVLVAIFRFHSAVQLGPALLVLAAGAAAYGLWLRREPAESTAPVPAAELPAEGLEPSMRRNPLELNSALFFALMFVVVSLATKYALLHYQGMGLRALSFLVGCSDITPFILSVLQGDLGLGTPQILQAIILATASNNVVKAAYTYLFGARRTARLAATGLLAGAALSILYAVLAL